MTAPIPPPLHPRTPKAFGRNVIAVALIAGAAAVGTAGTAMALPAPVAPADESATTTEDIRPIVLDHQRYAGERFRVHGLVYSDAAVWTLAFVTGGPTEFYTLDGARVELTGSGSRDVTQGDIFTGVITITGEKGISDPEVTLDDVTVVGRGSS